MKKYIIYFLGVILLSFGIGLNYKCGFGSSSIDSLTMNITRIVNNEWLSVGRCVIIFNIVFVIIYFLVYRPKDIYLPILVAVVLGSFTDLFNTFINIGDALYCRILFFVLAINCMSLGVALTIIHNLSPSPYECMTKLVSEKIFKSLSYGQAKMVVEAFVILISSVIALIFFHNFGEVNIATLIILVIQGPLIDLYVKILKKIKFLN